MQFINEMVPYGFTIIGIFIVWGIMLLQIDRDNRRQAEKDEERNRDTAKH